MSSLIATSAIGDRRFKNKKKYNGCNDLIANGPCPYKRGRTVYGIECFDVGAGYIEKQKKNPCNVRYGNKIEKKKDHF